ncbi:MAG TPA: acyl-CoA dehydrogenase family protein, partial [Candidatus Lustribacter sp.]|nr:acyl-CoA dehydrogenase family protein [Candidatus Lustribacter sp.]
DVFALLGELGLLSLAYPEEYGGGGQPYEVYLQVVEEIATVWMSIAVGVSVHGLTCFPVATFGTDAQKQALLPDMLSGSTLGAYCLSEPEAGSDVAAISTRAVAELDAADEPTAYRLTGTKAWISHAGHADFYTTFVRTSHDGPRGLSCFVIPGGTEGLTFSAPERKMGLHCDTVSQVHLDHARVAADRLIGGPGRGMTIALSALSAGRLGIAAAATGLAQAALDRAVAYAKERRQFGQRIGDFQGLGFMLADMEASVLSARANYLQAARIKDSGRDYAMHAAAAKLVCTDTAMKVTTDAIQILGGYGYTEDFAVERYFREAKVTQIFEGTNQIQRLVISRQLMKD